MPDYMYRLLLTLAVILLAGCAQDSPVVIHGQTMGTTFTVKAIRSDNTSVKTEALQLLIEKELFELNLLMSTYIVDSELSRLNRSPLNEPFPVSADTRAVLEKTLQIYRMSGEKFDATVGPLVNLWGFGPGGGGDQIPGQKQIDRALQNVGMNKLSLDSHGVTRQVASYVDLSAIVKGYAVDQISALLENQGFVDYLVEIGGELKAKGRNDQGKTWRIAIEKPSVLERAPYKAIALMNMGMATSGDYRNYFEKQGRRYSHTLDPTTGYPIVHNVASVTVIAESTMFADGVATAINVMGLEDGMAMAEANNIAVLVIIKSGTGFSEHLSSAFSEYLQRADVSE
jgi:thiamine biosynthesis lipoprotein